MVTQHVRNGTELPPLRRKQAFDFEHGRARCTWRARCGAGRWQFMLAIYWVVLG